MIKINKSVTVNTFADRVTNEYSEELKKWNSNITIRKTNPSEIVFPNSIKVEYKNFDSTLKLNNDSNSNLQICRKRSPKASRNQSWA